jgi:hypothetical protein
MRVASEPHGAIPTALMHGRDKTGNYAPLLVQAHLSLVLALADQGRRDDAAKAIEATGLQAPYQDLAGQFGRARWQPALTADLPIYRQPRPSPGPPAPTARNL